MNILRRRWENENASGSEKKKESEQENEQQNVLWANTTAFPHKPYARVLYELIFVLEKFYRDKRHPQVITPTDWARLAKYDDWR